MKLRNNASIARVVVALADVFEDGPGADRIAGSVLSRAPGDGAVAIIRDVASAIGLNVVHVRVSVLDGDPDEFDVRVRSPIDEATSGHRPVLVLVDEAHGASPGMVHDVCAHVRSTNGKERCLILAICTPAAERGVAEQVAAGLDQPLEEIAIHRTAEENQRLLRRVVEAMD